MAQYRISHSTVCAGQFVWGCLGMFGALATSKSWGHSNQDAFKTSLQTFLWEFTLIMMYFVPLLSFTWEWLLNQVKLSIKSNVRSSCDQQGLLMTTLKSKTILFTADDVFDLESTFLLKSALAAMHIVFYCRSVLLVSILGKQSLMVPSMSMPCIPPEILSFEHVYIQDIIISQNHS